MQAMSSRVCPPCAVQAMISDWRRKFQLPDMSFFFVQLAPSTQLGDFVKLRNAQMARR